MHVGQRLLISGTFPIIMAITLTYIYFVYLCNDPINYILIILIETFQLRRGHQGLIVITEMVFINSRFYRKTQAHRGQGAI